MFVTFYKMFNGKIRNLFSFHVRINMPIKKFIKYRKKIAYSMTQHPCTHTHTNTNRAHKITRFSCLSFFFASNGNDTVVGKMVMRHKKKKYHNKRLATYIICWAHHNFILLLLVSYATPICKKMII